MSPEHVRDWPDSGDFGVTELTLALPGTSNGRQKSGIKRGFLTTVDLKLGDHEQDVNKSISSITKPSPKTSELVVGWPPVRTLVRRKYVKVAVDGAAYLRKLDLHTYHSYQQLLTALQNLFQGLIIYKSKTVTELELESRKQVKEFIATYEDKDGDLMLLGDVPWMMFVESCKRLRLIKNADAIGLVAR